MSTRNLAPVKNTHRINLRISMNSKVSMAINVVLVITILGLALNALQTTQQLDGQVTDSKNSIDAINASITAIKVHESELQEKQNASAALISDLIIKTQEQGQIIDELVAKQTKKK